MERWHGWLDGRFKKCKQPAFIIFPQINESQLKTQNIDLPILLFLSILYIHNPTLFCKQPNIFYFMKSKLQTSIAELHKLKNQIRVQLNLLRPCGSPVTFEKKEHSTKKQFGKQFQATDIIHPSAEKSPTSNKNKKRFYDTDRMVLGQTSRSAEKKHYQRHYTDSVRLDNSIKKRTCSYFNIRKDSTPSPSKHENTSLTGIGANDKSEVQQSKSCIRVYYNRMKFNPNYY